MPGSAEADSERKEDEPPEGGCGTIRFSGVYIRAALQQADGVEVYRIQPVEEERGTEEAERERAAGGEQSETMERGMRKAEPEVARLESILPLWEHEAGVPDSG